MARAVVSAPPRRTSAGKICRCLDLPVSHDELTVRALNRATLARQLLLERSEMPVEAALEHLLGLQAQTPQTWYVGMWSRLRDFDPETLSAMVVQRRAVRIAVMRSTIHLVTARDAWGLRPLVQPAHDRMLQSNFGSRLAGLDRDEVVHEGRAIVEERPVTFKQLGERLRERWPEADPLALSMLIRTAVPLVQVPPRGLWRRSGPVAHTSMEAWLGEPPADLPSIDEVMVRYLAAFGPASVMDAQAWSGLTRLGEVFERLRPRLMSFRDDAGRELFDLPDGSSTGSGHTRAASVPLRLRQPPPVACRSPSVPRPHGPGKGPGNGERVPGHLPRSTASLRAHGRSSERVVGAMARPSSSTRLFALPPEKGRPSKRKELRCSRSSLRTERTAMSEWTSSRPPTPGPHVPESDATTAAIGAVDAIFERAFDGGAAPGIVWGVVIGGELVHHRGLGTLRVGVEATPDADSVFRIASMTKSFTAATVISLRDEGRLGLDDPVARWVPELAAAGPLQCRLAGDHDPTPPHDVGRVPHRRPMGRPATGAGPPRRSPISCATARRSRGRRGRGSSIRTSDTGSWAGSSRTSPGANIGTRSRERFLRPLGMTATTYTVEDVPHERLALGYVRRDDAWLA